MGVIFASMYREVLKGQRVVGPESYNTIALACPELRRSGFTAIQFPPFCKTQSGAANNADGYGLYDPYDLGTKNQSYSVGTYFGTGDELRRAIAIAHACGLQAYGDYVIHQYDGGNNGEYQYLGADGKTKNGRFPKHAACFVGNPPRVPVDPVFDSNGNFAFGDMVSFVNSTPKGYMLDQTRANLLWWVQTTAVDGARLDDTKGENAAVTADLMQVVLDHYPSFYWFGECFVGDPNELESWVQQMRGRSGTIDFTVHWHLQNVCDNQGNAYDLISPGAAFFKRDPTHAVSYIESADTDTTPGQQIISNKGLAYWFLLTSEGYPVVYSRDYLHLPNCYGLKPLIDNLIWIHENLAFGPTVARYGDSRAIVYERMGYPGLLCAGNWDTWNRKPLTVQTNFGANVRLHDYTGHHPDIWTDEQGKASFTIPSNAYGGGTSYLCFSRVGYSQSFTLSRRATTQTFFGDADLDIGPATAAGTPVGRIWCEAGTKIALAKPVGDGVRFDVVDAAGEKIIARDWESETTERGWHTITAFAPSATPVPFQVQVTYTATQGLLPSDLSLTPNVRDARPPVGDVPIDGSDVGPIEAILAGVK